MLFPRRNMHSQLLRGLALAGLAAVSLAESVLSWRGVNGSCPGEAFKRPSVTSLEQCQRLCEGQERCRGVTYHRLSQACELLSHAEESDARCYNEHHVEVFVMMPLDLVSLDGTLQQDQLDQIWPALKTSQADGFMVDVWWGITEPSPKQYDFSAYRKLFDQAKSHGFKVQAVTSFHQCGNNVGDDCYIPIPEFVRKVPSIWYKDFKGQETQEYISLFADEVPVTDEKRTPLEMYGDWFEAFRKEFQKDLGDPIVEIMVGLGPCGEMRYPSYRLDKWAFPGIGSFQCFDDHALKSLRTAMDDPSAMPPKVDYNSRAEDAGSFFAKDTSSNYASADGRRFLDWYSGSLKHHATAVLQLAQKTFPKKVRLAAKISGVHWWYDSPSHAAEVTAGYYNTNGHDAYKEIAEVLQKAGTDVYGFTCLEMRDEEQPGNALSSPERLVKQSQQAAAAASLHFAGENALERYDQHAYDQMLVYQESLYGLTFLRMTKKLMQSDNLQRFRCFVLAMQGKPTSDCDNLPPSRPEPDFGPVLLLVAALLLLGLLVFAWLLRRARRLETERRRLETETVEIGGVSRF